MEKPEEIIIENPEDKKKKTNRILLFIIGALLTVFVWSAVGYVFKLIGLLVKLVVVVGIVYLVFRYFGKRKG